MGRLSGRVALITGGSRGIGAACAVALAREGCAIAVAAKTVEPNDKLPGTLNDTVAAVEAVGGQAIAIACDVRYEEAVDSMVRQCLDRFGRIDFLLNNAGAIFWSGVGDWPVKKFDLVFGVNVRASFLCARAVLPTMRRQGFGHILMMSPPEYPEASPGKAPYLVSKIGMTMLARAIDAEEKAAGIAASALWPVAAIRTAATENLGMGDPGAWRTPEIVADATVELLVRDPKACTFRAWLDEDLLREAGWENFDRYRCVPGVEPPPMSIDLVRGHATL